MHPFFYSCPLKYLALVPVEQFGGNPEWRGQVHEYHARIALKRRARKAARKDESDTRLIVVRQTNHPNQGESHD